MNNIRRGWCPSLYKPMEAGDGFLCRIKPSLSEITGHQARFIANISTQYGNGYINLSQKANLQLRGFQYKDIETVIPLIVQKKLASSDEKVEEKRNILVSPLKNIDPLCHPETHNLALQLQSGLLANSDLHPLSGKFSFIVDGGGKFSLRHQYADINIRVFDENWIIQLGRCQQVILCLENNVVPIALEIMRFCIHRRIKRLLCEENAQAYLQQTPYQTTVYVGQIEQDSLKIGQIETALHIGVPFGLFQAQDLHYLGGIADQYGSGIIRLTPWRSIILPNCSAEILPLLSKFIIANNDPRHRIVLCPGKPFCLQGQQPTMQDVVALLPLWKNQRSYLHLSGCAKGCASPQINLVTLCATNQGYNLIFNGRADQNTPYQNLDLTEIIHLLKTNLSLPH